MLGTAWQFSYGMRWEGGSTVDLCDGRGAPVGGPERGLLFIFRPKWSLRVKKIILEVGLPLFLGSGWAGTTYLKIRIFAPVIACEKAALLRNRETSPMSSTRKEMQGGWWWVGGRRPRRLFVRSFTVRARNGEFTRMLLRTVINVKEIFSVQFWLSWCKFEISAFISFRANRTADGL